MTNVNIIKEKENDLVELKLKIEKTKKTLDTLKFTEVSYAKALKQLELICEHLELEYNTLKKG